MTCCCCKKWVDDDATNRFGGHSVILRGKMAEFVDQDTPFGKSVWTSHNTHKVGEGEGHNPFDDPDESDGGNPLEDMLKPV